MTVVIADSSPLNYLTLIGSVDVLHRLYGTVIVPQQIITELTDPAAPPTGGHQGRQLSALAAVHPLGVLSSLFVFGSRPRRAVGIISLGPCCGLTALTATHLARAGLVGTLHARAERQSWIHHA